MTVSPSHRCQVEYDEYGVEEEHRAINKGTVAETEDSNTIVGTNDNNTCSMHATVVATTVNRDVATQHNRQVSLESFGSHQQRCCSVVNHSESHNLPIHEEAVLLSRKLPSLSSHARTFHDFNYDDEEGEKKDDGANDDVFMARSDFNSSLPIYMEEDDDDRLYKFGGSNEAMTATALEGKSSSSSYMYSSPLTGGQLASIRIPINRHNTNDLYISALRKTSTTIKDTGVDDESRDRITACSCDKYLNGIDSLVQSFPSFDDCEEEKAPHHHKHQENIAVERNGASSPRRDLFNHDEGPARRNFEHRRRAADGGGDDFSFARRFRRKTIYAPFSPNELFSYSSW
jgi:hypothetical protein